jgi:hypothetical protein
MNENNILNVLKQCFETFIPAEDARTTITPLEFAINLVFCYLGDSKTFSLESIRRSMMAHLNKSIGRGTFLERLSGNRLKRNLQGVITELMVRLATSVQVSETILKRLGVTAIELVDSSSVTLLAGAENAFPGTRTKAVDQVACEFRSPERIAGVVSTNAWEKTRQKMLSGLCVIEKNW